MSKTPDPRSPAKGDVAPRGADPGGPGSGGPDFSTAQPRLADPHTPNPRAPDTPPDPRILGLGPVALISVAQLFGTSLWFSANAATDGLMRDWGATAADIGWLTNAVQAGFILGTLGLSLSGLADRFRASTLFVISAVLGALANAAFAWLAHGVGAGIGLRFVVGLALAGVYPIGMKLVVGWAPQRTGPALAVLVSMLVLGTALPHLLRFGGAGVPWQWIVTASSALALIGAALVARLGDGPHLPRRVQVKGQRAGQGAAPSQPPADPTTPPAAKTSALAAFRLPRFRAAALGYFGHMWEVYALWTLVPLLAVGTGLSAQYPWLGPYGLSFAVIGMGAVGCLIGGHLSARLGSERVALAALSISGLCALGFAALWSVLPAPVLLVLMLIWGASVAPDSPQFSALSADASPREAVGGALAIQNAVGFAISMVSIGWATALYGRIGADATWLLVPGPALGIAAYILTRRAARW